jgi:hypothetical protein
MPTTPEIAQAVADSLNAASFSQPVTAERAWLPVYDLGEMDQLRVTVVPTTRTLATVSRAAIQAEHRIEVAVQRRVDPGDLPAVDALVALCGEIAEHLTGAVLPALPELRWAKTEHTLLAAPEHLNELRQFTGLIAVTYRSWEDLGP